MILSPPFVGKYTKNLYTTKQNERKNERIYAKTTNAPEKIGSSPRRLSVDARYLPPWHEWQVGIHFALVLLVQIVVTLSQHPM